ncbi:histone acetyltransferase [Halorussus amylolyticus]|uniref:histone acetyltransferase n=1 Tax=Halorussus amylolyticus TaxID=1126242 RepID=UPI00104B36AA|nr:histone acetyltransferase [Halorussus amylolyticus]
MRDAEVFAVPLTGVRPSQLYLNGRKLALVTQWFDFDDPNYDPLPVREIEGRWTLTDGHTRAFVAFLSGATELRATRDDDDLPMGTYRRCVEWCEDEGVTEIGDLAGRVVSADAFEKKWVARCRSVADRE